MNSSRGRSTEEQHRSATNNVSLFQRLRAGRESTNLDYIYCHIKLPTVTNRVARQVRHKPTTKSAASDHKPKRSEDNGPPIKWTVSVLDSELQEVIGLLQLVIEE